MILEGTKIVCMTGRVHGVLLGKAYVVDKDQSPDEPNKVTIKAPHDGSIRTVALNLDRDFKILQNNNLLLHNAEAGSIVTFFDDTNIPETFREEVEIGKDYVLAYAYVSNTTTAAIYVGDKSNKIIEPLAARFLLRAILTPEEVNKEYKSKRSWGIF